MNFTPISSDDLESLLNKVQKARIAVLGDYCLDIYWMIDLARSEPSVETGKPTHPVRTQQYNPGGAGNAVNNIVEIGCGTLYAMGVVGNDPFGQELTRILEHKGVHTGDMLVQSEDWATLAYTKPHINDEECNRIDFGNYNQLSPETARALLDRVRERMEEVDVFVVNEQVKEGIHSPELREGLREIIISHPEKIFIVDSRHLSEFYLGAWLKLNDLEATRICGADHAPEDEVPREEAISSADALYERGKNPVFVTRGSQGVVVRNEKGASEIPGVPVTGRIDTVGAGDSVLAGISLAIAAGCDPGMAAQLGNLVAAVTVKKIHQTGTATPAEILEIAKAM